jgi:LuxR family transcriptional regulator, maltose regulon positive regulatory protein
VALGRCERLGEAQAAIESLLRETCAEGFVQMFAEEGPLAAALVRQFAATPAGQRACAEPVFGGYLLRVLQAFGVAHEAAVESMVAAPAEPLTRKELKVLALVAEGLGDLVIAEKLFLSLSTVRTHLRNTYAKLSVHSRMQAVLTARRAGWL